MSLTTRGQGSQVRTRQGSKHDKTGCLTCRHRRKKCIDNSFPVCGTCARLNLRCVRQPARDVVPGNWTEQKGASRVDETPSSQVETPSVQTRCQAEARSPLPLASLGLSLPCGTNGDSVQKRHALRYYISVLTTHLTVSQEFNFFLTAFLPMAMESVALFDVLLALASAHLSLTDEAHKVAALENRSTAIRNLAAAISTPSDQLALHETNAAACLGFVIYEAGMGDCRTWYTHLKGAHNVIASASAYSGGRLVEGPETFKASMEGQWILRNFAYHDVIGSITLRRRPLLNGEYLDGITDVIDSCLGVAVGLLRILARISCLDADTSLEEQTMLDDAMQQRFLATCGEIEQGLFDWECRADAEPGLASLAYAYRNATLIALYQLMRGRLKAGYIGYVDGQTSTSDAMEIIQAKIQAQVSDTMRHLANIPIGSAPESALLFPVFMVGGEARDETQMNVIRTRLQLMADKRQFRNLSQARYVLEDLWDLWKTQGADADWTQIQDTSAEGLLLT